MSFQGQSGYVNVSNRVKTNPADGNKGNRADVPFDNDKCQLMEGEDIAYFFNN